MQDILRKEDALELDQEEIGELLQIFQDPFDGFLRQSVVFARPERACQALVENELTSSFRGGGD